MNCRVSYTGLALWTCLTLCGACVPPVETRAAPCPCASEFYCCPHTNQCERDGDPICWSDSELAPVRLLAQHLAPVSARAVTLIAGDNSLVVLAAGGDGIAVVDLTNTSKPHWVSMVATPGEAHHVALSSDRQRAYVAMGQDGVAVLDGTALLQGNADPRLLSTLNAHDEAWHTAARDPFVYVADRRSGVQVIRLSETEPPQERASVASRGATLRGDVVAYSQAHSVVLHENLGLIADGDGGLHILDVAAPDAPMHLARFPEDRFAQANASRSVAVSGSHALLCDARRGLEIVTLSAPEQPERIATYDVPCRHVAASENVAVVATMVGWILVLDVSTKSAPTLLGAHQIGKSVSWVDIDPETERIYAVGPGAGLNVFEVAATNADATDKPEAAP